MVERLERLLISNPEAFLRITWKYALSSCSHSVDSLVLVNEEYQGSGPRSLISYRCALGTVKRSYLT